MGQVRVDGTAFESLARGLGRDAVRNKDLLGTSEGRVDDKE